MTEFDHQERYSILEQYFRAEADNIVSFATHLLNNRSLAEVAMQDTFVFALENMDKMLSSPEPVGWLYNVMKYIIKHMQRDQQKLIKRAISLDNIAELPGMKRFVNCNFSFIDARCKKRCKMRLVERLKPFSGVGKVLSL